MEYTFLLTLIPIGMIITSYARRWFASHRSKLEAINFEKELVDRARAVYDFHTATDKLPGEKELKNGAGNWYIRSDPPTGMPIHSPRSCQINTWVTPNGHHCGNIQAPITQSFVSCNQYYHGQPFDLTIDYLTNPSLTNQCKLDISISKINDFTKKIRHDYNHLTDSEKDKFENDAEDARSRIMGELVYRAKDVREQAVENARQKVFKKLHPDIQKIISDDDDDDAEYESLLAKLEYNQQHLLPPNDRLLKEGQTPLPPTLGTRRKIKY